MAHPSVAVLEYHLVSYRRMWRSTLFSSFAMPVLLFVGVGASVGEYVDRGDALPVPYLHYIAGGMLAFTGMQVAITESGFPVQSYMTWDKVYHGMAATPVRVADILAGHLLYIALRVAAASAAFLVVMVPFGAVGSAWAVLTPLVAALVGLSVAAPMFAYSASVTGPYLMTVMRFATMVMTFFSGAYFPVDQLREPLSMVAYPLPLWHGVELCRAAALGTGTAWPVAAHVGVLAAWFAGGLALAHPRFVKRLAT
ncbi:ABC transporter permease [Actinomadura decatromicini]|uniref:ABC transporter n=1 Tax=Actinomadura decatromicini TaxID=2604572 RepID=A0A5D3FVZ2_9ACTN|nr:ABC transporter permease [Actinomadura decatromicini]TYK52403.1 ABC transporter [Actinomadura decatromicini]